MVSSQRLHFGRLVRDSASEMARLQRSARGRRRAQRPAELSEQLLRAERSPANLGLALRDGKRLVGYLLAYVEAHGASGEIIYIADLLVLPRYRRHLPELLGRWCDGLRRSHPQHPLEARRSQADRAEWVGELGLLLWDLGYRLAAFERLEARAAGQPSLWLRWERGSPPRDDPRALPLLTSCAVGSQVFDVRLAQSEIHWERLEPYWDELLHSTPGATAFQSFAYLRTWWRCFGAGRRLCVVTLWRGAKLCAVAPLQIRALRAPLGYRAELGFIGGRSAHRPALLLGAPDAAFLEVLLRCLALPVLAWDRILLHEQPLDATCVRALHQRAAAGRLRLRTEPAPASAFLPIDQSFKNFFAARSRGFRKRVRDSLKKLRAAGDLALEQHSEWPQLQGELARYRALESRSWKRGQHFAVAAPGRSEFYAELAATLGPKGRLRIAFLTLDGVPIAGAIGLVDAANYHCLEIASDAELGVDFPGAVLEYLELQQFFSNGCSEYNFLDGFLGHQRQWTARTRDRVDLHCAKPSAATALRRVWRTRIRPRVQTLLAHPLASPLRRAR